jgi:hypothetical protein
MSNIDNNKRGRGRPRKIKTHIIIDRPDKNDDSIYKNDVETEDIIIICFPLTDNEEEEEVVVEKIVPVNSDKNIPHTDKNITVLLNEIKKKDAIIKNLKSVKTTNVLEYNITQENNNKIMNNIKCWWCDELFKCPPAHIVNYYVNDIYYVIGNFCSFNCALKHNLKMMKDYKYGSRNALTLNLKHKLTGNDDPVILAKARETLISKGGKLTIEQFRQNFIYVNENLLANVKIIVT